MQENNLLLTNQKENNHKKIPPVITKITGSNCLFSVLSLNINGRNFPIERRRLTDWIHKQDTTFCCIQEIYLCNRDRHYLKVKGWKRILQENGPKKQAGVAILLSNKINFQPKVIKKVKEGDFILIKGKITKKNSLF
jgi:exonuclease III